MLLLAGFVFRRPLLTALGNGLVEDDGAQRADCILVLGGDEFGARIVKAAQLAQAGFAPVIFVDGPTTLIGHESDYTIQYAALQGFTKSQFRPVWLPAAVNSTGTEVRWVADSVLRRYGVKKVLLVTSNYHTHRAAHLMRKEVPWITVVAVAAPDPFFSPDSWWKSRNGKKTFVLESIKTVAEWWGV